MVDYLSFMENGSMGMLGASKYNEFDQVFPLFGKIIDLCSGNSTSASESEVCRANVDLVHRSYRLFQSPGWTEVELAELQGHIDSFNQTARALFGPYWDSCMTMLKWHALNHLVDASRHAGALCTRFWMFKELLQAFQRTFQAYIDFTEFARYPCKIN